MAARIDIGVDDLKQQFEAAASFVRTIVGKLDTKDLLYFYAHFKQAKEGPNNTSKPGFFDFQGKQKWQAWKDLGDLPPETAMQTYIDHLTALEPGWTSQDVSNEQNTGWVSVSTMAEPAENAIPEEDKTLFDHVKEGDLAKVKKAASQSSNMNVKDDDGLGLLHWAADRGHLDLTDWLLDQAGIDVHLRDEYGQTPLHYAASCGHKAVVELLLAKGADKDVCDDDGLKAADVALGAAIKELLQL